MSSDDHRGRRRDAVLVALVLAGLAAVAAPRLPAVLAEARQLAATLERDGPQARNCASVLAGSGEVAAVLAALEAFGRHGDGRPPHCAAAVTLYFPLAAS